jgi:hypothetical protein
MRTKRIGFALIAVCLSTAPLGCGASYDDSSEDNGGELLGLETGRFS